MRGEYRLRQCAGFEQGETEDNGIGCKGEYRAVQIVRYYHVVHQNRVNADAYHNEEALKTDRDVYKRQGYWDMEPNTQSNIMRG